MAKKYYWLKLMNDFFTQPKIKKLRRIAGGDTYTIIYLKMQLLSLRDNGKLFFEGIEDGFEEEIALTIDEDVENVKVTIQYLMSQGLLDVISENEFLMTETQSLIGVESDSAQRVRKHRLKKSLQCNGCVTLCNTDIDIDIDKDIDKSINTFCPEPLQAPDRKPVICLILNDNTEYPIYQEDVEKWKTLYPAVDIVQELNKMYGWIDANPTRRKTKRGIKRFINNWLSKEQDKPKKQSFQGTTKPNTFMNFEQRNTDYDALVANYSGFGGK